MNNTFNTRRFSLLLKRQWLEFGKIYLMSLGIIVAIIVGFYLFNFPDITEYKKTEMVAYRINFREPLFTLLGPLFISIIAGTYFAHLGNKAKATSDLLTPASKLEKYATAIIYTSIVPILSYVFIFSVVDFCFVQAYLSDYSYVEKVYEGGQYVNRTIEKGDWLFFNHSHLLHSYFNEVVLICSSFSILITAVFLMGSIYFNRFQYIKTLVTVSALVSVAMPIYVQAGKFFFHNKVRISTDNSLSGPGDNGPILIATGITIIALFFYIVGYIRYKEKEV